MTVRRYEAGEVTVLWDSSRCVHFAACVRTLPDVFDPRERPWVRPAGADTEELMAAIRRCPTGALRYERRDGEPEPAELEATIVPVPNGPLVVRGLLHVLTADGETVTRETRLALCRCGATGNAPFCDGTHHTNHFRSRVPAPSEARQRAASPDDVAAPQELDVPEGGAV